MGLPCPSIGIVVSFVRYGYIFNITAILFFVLLNTYSPLNKINKYMKNERAPLLTRQYSNSLLFYVHILNFATIYRFLRNQSGSHWCQCKNYNTLLEFPRSLPFQKLNLPPSEIVTLFFFYEKRIKRRCEQLPFFVMRIWKQYYFPLFLFELTMLDKFCSTYGLKFHCKAG